MWLSKNASPTDLSIKVESAANISDLADAAYDDVIYFGTDIETVQERRQFGKSLVQPGLLVAGIVPVAHMLEFVGQHALQLAA